VKINKITINNQGDPEIDVAKIEAALLDGSDLNYEQQTQVIRGKKMRIERN
jgi:hypothetical protein